MYPDELSDSPSLHSSEAGQKPPGVSQQVKGQGRGAPGCRGARRADTHGRGKGQRPRGEHAGPGGGQGCPAERPAVRVWAGDANVSGSGLEIRDQGAPTRQGGPRGVLSASRGPARPPTLRAAAPGGSVGQAGGAPAGRALGSAPRGPHCRSAHSASPGDFEGSRLPPPPPRRVPDPDPRPDPPPSCGRECGAAAASGRPRSASAPPSRAAGRGRRGPGPEPLYLGNQREQRLLHRPSFDL